MMLESIIMSKILAILPEVEFCTVNNANDLESCVTDDYTIYWFSCTALLELTWTIYFYFLGWTGLWASNLF